MNEMEKKQKEQWERCPAVFLLNRSIGSVHENKSVPGKNPGKREIYLNGSVFPKVLDSIVQS